MKIKLNTQQEENKLESGYRLDFREKYVINIDDEIDTQIAILQAMQIMGFPLAIKNYHSWLFENGLSVESPNPTNDLVSKYWGVKPLWKTDYSQGIVVKSISDEDYYIIMECSANNEGFKRTEVILTLNGCL